MGLKNDRTALSYEFGVIKSRPLERGLVVFYPDKRPMGVLLQDVVVARIPDSPSIWMTDKRYTDNQDEVCIGYLTQGIIVTNMLEQKRAYKAGKAAFFNRNGYFTDRGKYLCGRFLTGLNSEGYVKVQFDIAPALEEFYMR